MLTLNTSLGVVIYHLVNHQQNQQGSVHWIQQELVVETLEQQQSDPLALHVARL